MGYHQNEETTKQAVQDAQRFINDRERYKYLAQILLDHLGHGDADIIGIIRDASEAKFDRIEQLLNQPIGVADLMVDEFERIKVLAGKDTEIYGICQRAVVLTKQRIPVIQQRDEAIQKARKLQRQLDAIKSKGELNELFGNE